MDHCVFSTLLLHPLVAFLPAHSCSGSFQAGGGLEADRGSHEELSSLPCGPAGGSKQKMQLDYNVYMAKYVNPQAPPRSPFADDSPGQSPESSPQTTKKV